MTAQSPHEHDLQDADFNPHVRLVIDIYKNISLVLEAIRSEYKTQHMSGQMASTLAKSREENCTFLFEMPLIYAFHCLIDVRDSIYNRVILYK